jgi:UDP-glucose 4-epimerase
MTCCATSTRSAPTNRARWGRTRGHSQQSDALYHPGGHGPSRLLSVFGNDYDTPDGTGVRDYIHVMDLAEGHVAAVKYLLERERSLTVNLGTGQGYSVLEVIRAFEAASGRSIAHQIVDRRPGDVAACYADPAAAERLLGWKARRGLPEMCADSWRWQSRNPQGFEGA